MPFPSRSSLSLVGAACTVLGAALLAGCAGSASQQLAEPAPGRGPVAVARFLDVQGRPAGGASFTPAGSGVEVMVEVTGISPGLHGFHVHEKGECADGPDPQGKTIPFGAAGGHFDPGGAMKHGRPGQPAHTAHAGELPNIEVGPGGSGTLRYLSPNLSGVTGAPNSVFGRAVVVHEKPDDYTTSPAGNSGGRILCGVIVPAQARGTAG